MKLTWWEDRVDEMFIALIVGAIAVVAIFKGGAAGTAIAGTAVGGLCVVFGGKAKQSENGGSDETT